MQPQKARQARQAMAAGWSSTQSRCRCRMNSASEGWSELALTPGLAPQKCPGAALWVLGLV